MLNLNSKSVSEEIRESLEKSINIEGLKRNRKEVINMDFDTALKSLVREDEKAIAKKKLKFAKEYFKAGSKVYIKNLGVTGEVVSVDDEMQAVVLVVEAEKKVFKIVSCFDLNLVLEEDEVDNLKNTILEQIEKNKGDGSALILRTDRVKSTSEPCIVSGDKFFIVSDKEKADELTRALKHIKESIL